MELPQNTQSEPAGNGTSARTTPVLRTGGKFSSHKEIAVVQADYLALANDLEQAQALSSSLEMQLSGKSNELARFKAIWERAQADLAKLETDVDTMRKERHALANEVQRSYAFEHKYDKLKTVHEELEARAERLETELRNERAGHVQTKLELEDLRAEIVAKGTPRPAGNADPVLRRTLETIRNEIDRVLGGQEPTPIRLQSKPQVERIDIEFGT